MKFKTKFTGIASAVAIVSVMAACQNKEAAPAATKKADATTSVDANEKIVYVNSDSLLSKYQYFKDLKVKMEAKAAAADKDMAAKGQAFQRELSQYQQEANGMAADKRAAAEERLGRKQQELQTYRQNAGTALQNEQMTENEKLYDKVADYLKEYAKKKGYKMVLSYSKGNGTILFADESLEVTSEVIIGLNEAYKK